MNYNNNNENLTFDERVDRYLLSTDDRPLIDLKQLREDYHDGYSAMGHPNRGYYVSTYRGLESLQAFCTSEATLLYGQTASNNDDVREIAIKNDGSDYDMRAWTFDNFNRNLNRTLRVMGEGHDIDYGLRDKVNINIYEKIIDEIYDGEFDRQAYVSMATSRRDGLLGMELGAAMQLDILRAKDGATDVRAQAGAHAYRSVLSQDFNKLGSIDTLRNGEIPEDFWMINAEKAYLNYIIDDMDGSTPDTLPLKEGKTFIKEIFEEDSLDRASKKTAEWDAVLDYLSQDVVLMIDPHQSKDVGLGMKYQQEVHEAVDFDATDEFENLHDYESHNTVRVDPDKPINRENTFDDYDDDWDFDF